MAMVANAMVTLLHIFEQLAVRATCIPRGARFCGLRRKKPPPDTERVTALLVDKETTEHSTARP